jgi:hypothetical protein
VTFKTTITAQRCTLLRSKLESSVARKFGVQSVLRLEFARVAWPTTVTKFQAPTPSDRPTTVTEFQKPTPPVWTSALKKFQEPAKPDWPTAVAKFHEPTPRSLGASTSGHGSRFASVVCSSFSFLPQQLRLLRSDVRSCCTRVSRSIRSLLRYPRRQTTAEYGRLLVTGGTWRPSLHRS